MSATVVFNVQRQPSGKYNFACGVLGNEATPGEKAIAGYIAEWLESLGPEAPLDAKGVRQEAEPTRRDAE